MNKKNYLYLLQKILNQQIKNIKFYKKKMIFIKNLKININQIKLKNNF